MLPPSRGVVPPKQYLVPRRSPRTFMHAAAEVQCSAVAGSHVGVVRDLSDAGIFFYTDFRPPLGTLVRISFAPGNGNRSARVYCEGTVVRVEQPRAGAAPGIAVKLTRKKAAALRCSA